MDDMHRVLHCAITVIALTLIVVIGFSICSVGTNIVESSIEEMEDTIEEMEDAEEVDRTSGIIFNKDEETGEWVANLVVNPNASGVKEDNKDKSDNTGNKGNVAFGNQNNVVVENGDSIIVDEKVDYSKAIIVACIVLGVVVVVALFMNHKKNKMEHELNIMRHNEKVLGMDIGTYHDAEIQGLKDKYKEEDGAKDEKGSAW